MGKIYTEEDLGKLNKETVIMLFLGMQDQLHKINENMERLIEQIAVANNRKYGRSSEKLNVIDGQLDLSDFFNEAEHAVENKWVVEPHIDDAISSRPRKKAGKREDDLKDLPVEIISHELSDEKLKEHFGGTWKELPVEIYKRVKYEPAIYVVEVHHIHIYAGCDNQTIIRADRPADLLKNSIATPSLVASVMNAKYVNALPLNRIEQEFKRNDIRISRQVMANWMIKCAERHLSLVYDYLHKELLSYHYIGADEVPVKVTKDGRPAGSKSYMWIYRSGKTYLEQIILYDYQRTRNSTHPETFLKGFLGTCLTDGYSAYRKLGRENEEIRFAGCWAHARRRFSDAIKALKDKSGAKNTVAYEALKQIAAIYKLDNELWELEPPERLKRRQLIVKPLVLSFIEWVKREQADMTVPPKSKTADGLGYVINQEEYLKVFLDDPEVPLDNNATESAIRGFVIGRNNWKLIDTVEGAKASAIIYSVTETAKANKLNPYKYLKHLLTVIPQYLDGNDFSFLKDLMPWSPKLPEECHNLTELKQKQAAE